MMVFLEWMAARPWFLSRLPRAQRRDALGVVVGGLLLFVTVPGTFAAIPYDNPGPFTVGSPGDILPAAVEVPSKELSHFADRNAAGAGSPEQNVAWDGNPANPGGGAGVMDGNHYFGTQFTPPSSTEVDAIASHHDQLFDAVITDDAYLIFSIGNGTAPTGNGPVDTNSGQSIGRAGDLSYEAPVTGALGIWADGATRRTRTA